MRISFSVLFLILVFDTFSSSLQGGVRRLGKLETQSWDTHYALGQNLSPYEESAYIPSFSSVGALLSNDGVLGTASLIAPDTIITAAHVVKNRTSDPLPISSQWKFILFHDFESAPSNLEYEIKSFTIHPTWIERQRLKPPFGDGDRLGCDLAIAKLESSVIGYQPLRLPNNDSFSTGQKVYLAGFGNLVDGSEGAGNSDNSRRMAGENILDRIVTEVSITDSGKGGLLAFDFDSPSRNNNSLGINSSQSAFDNLTSGDSSETPLALEVSTAEGDSGGPLIAKQGQMWRLLGTVSYGSSNSTYGDISILSRLSNHTDWIQDQLPYWPEAMLLNDQGWIESDWLGLMMPFSSGWNYNINLGWLWAIPKSDDSFWLYKGNHLGWLWTGLSIYPFFFSNDLDDWLYMDIESSDEISWYLYNFSSKQWILFNL